MAIQTRSACALPRQHVEPRHPPRTTEQIVPVSQLVKQILEVNKDAPQHVVGRIVEEWAEMVQNMFQERVSEYPEYFSTMSKTPTSLRDQATGAQLAVPNELPHGNKSTILPKHQRPIKQQKRQDNQTHPSNAPSKAGARVSRGLKASPWPHCRRQWFAPVIGVHLPSPPRKTTKVRTITCPANQRKQKKRAGEDVPSQPIRT